MFDEILSAKCSEWGLPLSGEQLARLRGFAQLLLEKNKVMNLTAITELPLVASRHMADSLFLLSAAELTGKRILDVGTGAGFPGMPLALYDPGLDITMLDSTAKRIAFIEEGAKQLGISPRTATGRAEELGHSREMRGAFDIVTSRAVAPLNILCELCMPFLREGGLFLPMKSDNEAAALELEEAKSAIKALGGSFERAVSYEPEEGGSLRQLLFIRKTAATSPKYPRQFGKISKSPL